MRTVRLFSAAILAVSGLIAVGATTESANAASSKDLSVSHTHVMKSEGFSAYGRVSSHTVRTVKLQYRNHNHGAWKTKTTVKSIAGGYFEFYLSTSKTRYYRYYASKSGSSAKIVGHSRKVAVVAQSVKFFAVTPNSQCANLSHQNVTMMAEFYPARPGREVRFATNTGVVTAYQDGNGVASVNFAPGNTVFSYKAVATAQPADGAGAKSSPTYKYSQSLCSV